ncbi:hypothetical protein Tco_0681800 [Tanacetum coccineum]|uniref:MAK10-like protein n=1 Tax=Tanacetum coccineum TaxID=301880 RepID=A0ABQ4XQA4_9ASTR
MGDENPIRTLGDYSKPSHEGYRNTIELFVGNNVVPLRSDTIWGFTKPVKAIALPQDVPSTFDRRLIELENQVQRLMEAHLALTQPTQVNKITTSCEICSGPHDTQYCMEDPEQAFVEYASSRTDEAGGKWYTFKHEQNNLGDTYNTSWRSHPNLRLVPQSFDTEVVCTKGDDGEVMFIEIIRKNNDSREEGPEEEGSTSTEGVGVEYFDMFPTRSELAYHKYLMCGPIPSIFLQNPSSRKDAHQTSRYHATLGMYMWKNPTLTLTPL